MAMLDLLITLANIINTNVKTEKKSELFNDRINNFQINKRVLASGVLNHIKSLKNYVLSELKSHYKIHSL